MAPDHYNYHTFPPWLLLHLVKYCAKHEIMPKLQNTEQLF